MLYETRFGGLSDKRLPKITQFIEAVQNIFTTTEFLSYLPVKINRLVFRKWQKLDDESWGVIFETSKDFYDKLCDLLMQFVISFLNINS